MDHAFLHEAELALENLAEASGIARAVDAIEREVGSSQPVTRLLRGAVPVAADTLKRLLAEPRDRRAERRTAHTILSALDPGVCALIGLRHGFEGAVDPKGTGDNRYGMRLQNWTTYTARGVEIEFWAYCLRMEDPDLYKRIVMRQQEQHGNRKYRLKGAKAIASKAGFERPEWSRLLAGSVVEPILDAVLATGLFRLDVVGGEGTFLALSEEALALFVEQQELSLAVVRPVFMPMVVEPRRWQGWRDGPYLSQAANDRLSFMSSRDAGRNSLVSKALKGGRMPEVQDALDALQQTAFRIDEGTLEAVQVAREKGWACKKLPVASVPDYAFPEDYESLPPEVKKGHRLRAGEVRDLQRSVATDSVALSRAIETARMMAAYPAFHLPHNIDHRGRTYPVPGFSHHRADYVRGLFLFAEAEPLGDHGAEHLSVHLANCAAGKTYGKLDKLPYQERIDWVAKNNDLFRTIARDWRERPELWATGTDTPFAFLTAAREFDRLLSWVDAGGSPEAFESRVPCGLDGTNSGLQHYSAALRSREEGALVNLVDLGRPQDIYGVVADLVKKRIEADLTSDRTMKGKVRDPSTGKPVEVTVPVAPLARLWMDYGVDRGTVKRQVMTFAYSSERFGFTQQIVHDLMDPLGVKVLTGELPVHPFGEDGGFRAASLMAGYIWEVIGAVVPLAASAMRWFKDVALLMAKHGHPVLWVTPVGLPVLHRYQGWEETQVNLFLQNGYVNLPHGALPEEQDPVRRVALAMQTRPTGELLPHKQKNALAPNVIHSLDAAHLMKTANACRAEGIHSLAMVHDSFATHAGRTGDLTRILRQEFMRMYEGFCPFADIDRQCRKVLPEDAQGDIPPPPERGDLDLSEVLRSPYFFC